MTSNEPQGTPEHGPDPHGIRELLAAAEPVGPMPDALASRILASLQQEQQARAGQGPASPGMPQSPHTLGSTGSSSPGALAAGGAAGAAGASGGPGQGPRSPFERPAEDQGATQDSTTGSGDASNATPRSRWERPQPGAGEGAPGEGALGEATHADSSQPWAAASQPVGPASTVGAQQGHPSGPPAPPVVPDNVRRAPFGEPRPSSALTNQPDSHRTAGRSRSHQGFALAAAAAGVLLVGGVTLTLAKGNGNADSADNVAGAPVPSTTRSSDSAAGAAPNDSAARGSASQSPGSSSGAPSAGDVPITTIRIGSSPLSTANLDQRATALTTAAESKLSPGQAEAPSIGPLGTETGIRSCLEGLNLGTAEQVRVELSTFQGSSAALIVYKTGSVWGGFVVGQGCNVANPDIKMKLSNTTSNPTP